MSGWRLANECRAQKTAHGFASEGEALFCKEFFVEMMIVETSIADANQDEDVVAGQFTGCAGTSINRG